MELVKYNQISETMYFEYIKAWEGHMMVPSSCRFRTEDFKRQQERWTFEESEKITEEGFVPSALYFLVHGNHILGAIHLRFYLNDFLLKHGGHIGYGVHPNERQKGYADLMMTLIRPILKEHHLTKILLTCDEDNIGSNKTILKHGGKLENQVIFEGKLTNRYWIDLK